MSSSDPIVIVGSGLAGYNTARELRKLDPARPLRIVTADGGDAYAKPLLSNAFKRGLTAKTLPTADAARMAEELGAEIRTHTRVEALDPERHTVTVDGHPQPYSALVLGLGADPLRLDLAGDAAAEVYSVNDLAGYARFRAALGGARRVVLLGAGLIGCEFANDLCTQGYTVTVVEAMDQILGRFVPEPAARALQRALGTAGVAWRLGNRCVAVNRGRDGLRVVLADDETLETDVVLSAVGLRPRTGLASAAGLEVARAIVVDRELRTSATDVYALGDCMQVAGLWLPFIMPLMCASRALARTLSGEPTRLGYPVMPVLVKTPAHPIVLSPPPPGSTGGWEIESGDDGVRALFRDPDGLLLGATLTGCHVKDRMTLAKDLPPVLV